MTTDRLMIFRTGPLAVLAMANLASVIICAWPVNQSHLKTLATRKAPFTGREPSSPEEEIQWDHSEAWLESLAESDRKMAIKALRSFQSWLEEKPPAFQARLLSLSSREREELIDRTRQREREGPLSGLIHPSVLTESWADEFREFLSIKLLPRLTESELEELDKAASGERKAWLSCVARLAHDHLYLPQGPASVLAAKDLSTTWSKEFHSLDGETRKRLQSLEGRWPDFALSLLSAVELAKKTIPADPLGPCRWEDMPLPWQTALQSKNMPQQLNAEKNRIQPYEGNWPAYPRKFLEALRRKGLGPTGVRLPGPLTVWRGAFDSR